jgi:hypothetical protein
MEITKQSELLSRDLLSQIQTNVEGQLSFKNMNKSEWNNLPPEARAEFFMRNVFHDGVDPRLKNEINRLVTDKMDVAKQDLLQKVDLEVRNQAMSSVIKQLVEELNFNEI